MRRYMIMSALLTLLLMCSGCKGHNTAEKDTEAEAENGAVSLVPGQDADFSEGVWIRKYSDNYACFKFESPEGFQIVCDPFSIYEILQPDVVIESHQHADHTDTTLLEPGYDLIAKAGEYQYEEAEIKGYAGKHNKGDEEDTNYIFVIKMNDITIAHFASQGELPSDEVLDQIGPVDILLIQIFMNPDYNKLGMEDADAIIQKLKPKIVIPEHGDENMGSLLAEHLEVTQELMPAGDMIVTREMLDHSDGIRVVNLDNIG